MKSLTLITFILIYFWLPSAQAQEIKYGLHFSAPWAYLDDKGEIIGIERELITAALAGSRYQLRFSISGYSRLNSLFNHKLLDAASPIAPGGPYLYSAPFLPFKDVAVSLASRQLTIHSINDLVGIRMATYQKAQHVLGGDFKKLVQAQPQYYTEFVSRESQMKMLFLKRAEVAIGEWRILNFSAQHFYPLTPLSTHYIFTQRIYSAASWDTQFIAVLNQGLATIKASGRYQEILNRPRPYFDNQTTRPLP